MVKGFQHFYAAKGMGKPYQPSAVIVLGAVEFYSVQRMPFFCSLVQRI